MNIRHRGVEIISCPTCGRCQIDLFGLVDRVDQALSDITESPKVAIMGCVVNGPGEAKEADLGIAGGKGKGIFFRNGRVVKKIPEQDLEKVIVEEVKKFIHKPA